MHNNALIINKWWAGVISSLMCSAVIGGVVLMLALSNWQAVADERMENLTQEQVVIKQTVVPKLAVIDSRLDVIDTKMQYQQQSLEEIKKMLQEDRRTEERRGR